MSINAPNFRQPNGAPCAVSFVAGQVIENDDVAWGQGRREHLLDIGCEKRATDRTVDHSGRTDRLRVVKGPAAISVRS
ncbi:MAG: hypothetical protein ING02_09885 [Roseomonas sp.]|nr:hypothetical protein [Roseomonas sp.]